MMRKKNRKRSIAQKLVNCRSDTKKKIRFFDGITFETDNTTHFPISQIELTLKFCLSRSTGI